MKIFNITKKELIFFGTAALIFITAAALLLTYGVRASRVNAEHDYIRWIEFNARLSSLQKALKYDIDSYET